MPIIVKEFAVIRKSLRKRFADDNADRREKNLRFPKQMTILNHIVEIELHRTDLIPVGMVQHKHGALGRNLNTTRRESFQYNRMVHDRQACRRRLFGVDDNNAPIADQLANSRMHVQRTPEEGRLDHQQSTAKPSPCGGSDLCDKRGGRSAFKAWLRNENEVDVDAAVHEASLMMPPRWRLAVHNKADRSPLCYQQFHSIGHKCRPVGFGSEFLASGPVRQVLKAHFESRERRQSRIIGDDQGYRHPTQ
jgi:hypothetical protein